MSFTLLQAAAEPSPLGMLMPMALIFMIFYFLLIRPQARQQKEQEALRKGVEKGDEVVTTGGVHGKVVGTTDDVLTLEIATLKAGERIRIKLDRNKVESVKKGESQ